MTHNNQIKKEAANAAPIIKGVMFFNSIGLGSQASGKFIFWYT